MFNADKLTVCCVVLIAERFTVCLMYIYFKIVNVDMFTVWWYEDRFTVWLVCGQVYSVLICLLPEVGWSDLCAARSCHHQQT